MKTAFTTILLTLTATSYASPPPGPLPRIGSENDWTEAQEALNTLTGERLALIARRGMYDSSTGNIEPAGSAHDRWVLIRAAADLIDDEWDNGLDPGDPEFRDKEYYTKEVNKIFNVSANIQVIQIGGSEPHLTAMAAEINEHYDGDSTDGNIVNTQQDFMSAAGRLDFLMDHNGTPTAPIDVLEQLLSEIEMDLQTDFP